MIQLLAWKLCFGDYDPIRPLEMGIIPHFGSGLAKQLTDRKLLGIHDT